MTPPTVTDRIPKSVQIRIVREILASPHPRLAVPSIAHNHHLVLDDVQTVARDFGYPDRQAMQRAVDAAAAAHVSTVAQSAAEPGEYRTVDDGRYGLRDIPVTDLHHDPNNVRDYLGGREEFEELAESIAEAGLLQPIVARYDDAGRLIVLAGHRRLTAVRMLGWDTVETIVRAPMRPDDVIAAMLIENSQRRDLDPIEEARGLLRLYVGMKAEAEATGDSVSHLKLARRVGRTQEYVSRRLALLELDPGVQEELRSGQITLGAAVAKSRRDSGRVRPGAKGKKGPAHLSAHHELAGRAQARCTAAGHRAGKGTAVGGVACGACWESVIRADERRSLLERSASTGLCSLCDTPTGAPALTEAASS